MMKRWFSKRLPQNRYKHDSKLKKKKGRPSPHLRFSNLSGFSNRTISIPLFSLSLPFVLYCVSTDAVQSRDKNTEWLLEVRTRNIYIFWAVCRFFFTKRYSETIYHYNLCTVKRHFMPITICLAFPTSFDFFPWCSSILISKPAFLMKHTKKKLSLSCSVCFWWENICGFDLKLDWVP